MEPDIICGRPQRQIVILSYYSAEEYINAGHDDALVAQALRCVPQGQCASVYFFGAYHAMYRWQYCRAMPKELSDFAIHHSLLGVSSEVWTRLCSGRAYDLPLEYVQPACISAILTQAQGIAMVRLAEGMHECILRTDAASLMEKMHKIVDVEYPNTLGTQPSAYYRRLRP